MEMEQLWAERYGQNGIMGLDLFWEEGGDVEGRIEHTQKGTFFFFFFFFFSHIILYKILEYIYSLPTCANQRPTNHFSWHKILVPAYIFWTQSTSDKKKGY
jgi:hypothetical protein